MQSRRRLGILMAMVGSNCVANAGAQLIVRNGLSDHTKRTWNAIAELRRICGHVKHGYVVSACKFTADFDASRAIAQIDVDQRDARPCPNLQRSVAIGSDADALVA